MFDLLLTTLTLQLVLVWIYHNRGRFRPQATAHREIPPVEGSDAVARIREAIRGNLEAGAGRVAFAQWLAWKGTQHARLEANIPQLDRLKGVERELVHLTLQGMTPKEIARFKGVSGFHIYNVRSKVRRKLEVPENMELEDFLRAGNAKNIGNQSFDSPEKFLPDQLN